LNETILLLISTTVAALLTWIITKRLQAHRPEVKDLDNGVVQLNEIQKKLEIKENEIVNLKVKVGKLEQKVEDSIEYKENAELKWEEEVKTQRKNLEDVAREVLDTATKRSQTQLEGAHAENLKQLLNPVKEQFIGFKNQVEKYYGEEKKWLGELNKELDDLAKMNLGLNEQAENLAKALKGESKIQGDWGEYQLERLLEDVGLEKGVHFTTQSSVKSDDGKNLRPDFLVSLPDEKVLVIDSKVSLTAYEKCVNTQDDSERDAFLKEHIQSLRNHIRSLAKKDYASLYDKSVDYTLMFVPIEPAYFAVGPELQAIQREGLAARVILVSTTTMLATLRTVSYIWRQELQRTNVIEISSRGKLLYEKFVGFTNSMDSIGDHLKKAENAYQEAVNKLSKGSGHLVGQAEKLRKLGLDVNKKIPEKFISDSESDTGSDS
jgi:DNA recombination protein RmuC